MRYLILALLLIGTAQAQERDQVRVTWEVEFTRTDGTPDTAWTSSRVEWGLCEDGRIATVLGTKLIPAPGKLYTVKERPPGLWCVQVVRIGLNGEESDPSNVVSKLIVPAKLTPPRAQ